MKAREREVQIEEGRGIKVRFLWLKREGRKGITKK